MKYLVHAWRFIQKPRYEDARAHFHGNLFSFRIFIKARFIMGSRHSDLWSRRDHWRIYHQDEDGRGLRERSSFIRLRIIFKNYRKIRLKFVITVCGLIGFNIECKLFKMISFHFTNLYNKMLKTELLEKLWNQVVRTVYVSVFLYFSLWIFYIHVFHRENDCYCYNYHKTFCIKSHTINSGQNETWRFFISIRVKMQLYNRVTKCKCVTDISLNPYSSLIFSSN